MRYNSINILVALPLVLLLWQGSSCRSSNAVSNSKPTMNANSDTGTQSRDLRGNWGGDHVVMEITDDGATIEYDCAHGRITEKIAPDGNGKFVAKGFHAREGGPVRLNEENEQPAVYRGEIKNETMTIAVELTQNKESAGTFSLTKGKATRLRKCL